MNRLDIPASPVLSVAGGLSLAGVLLGILLLVMTFGGFDAGLYFSPAVLVLGVAGGVLTLIGSRQSPSRRTGPILASSFLSALALLGGLLEIAAWMRWPILHG